MWRVRWKSRLLVVLAICSGVVSGTCAASTDQQTADKILIEKAAHRMTLLRAGKVLRTYKVALGTEPTGAKMQQGDHKTPEGNYTVDRKNPQSIFHLALHLSYPSADDRARAKKLGVNPGGDVEIHGLAKQYAYLGALHRTTDWTDGCIAVTNAEIEEIWRMVPVGTPVEIVP